MKNWEDLICEDWPELVVDEQTRQAAIETSQSGRYSPLSPRLAIGRFYTNREYEARRQRVLSTPLP